MKPVTLLALVFLLLALACSAQELPEAPHAVVDKKFAALTTINVLATFADSYTTTWARQNWLAGKQNVCNVERQSPYLYGDHPTPGRAYAVAAVKSIGSTAASYYLRRHHHRFWAVPMIVNGAFGLQGMGQNLANCN